MSKNIEEHIHCKICQTVIEISNTPFDYVFTPHIALGVCEKCVIKEGIKSLKKKRK